MDQPIPKKATFTRTRRSLFRATTVTVGAAVAVVAMRKPASAQLLCQLLGLGCPAGGGSGGTSTCFARGTRILTVDGYRPVEALEAGDCVSARFAGAASVEKVTRFTLERTGPGDTWAGASRPVRVKAGALAPQSPAADIVLTAAHAVFVDGVLVPVINLVNGTSIVFETAEGQETIEFFHLALARHDVVDAEGAPFETWRDAALEEPCVPLLSFYGGRDELRSRLRSAASILVDRRRPLDIIRDTLEERGLELARVA